MTIAIAEQIGHRWTSSTTWPPEGLGCRLCHDNPPYRAKLCLPCLIRCTGWIADVVIRWIESQDASYTRQQGRIAALKLWHQHHDPSGIIKYAEEYGVWLMDSKDLI